MPQIHTAAISPKGDEVAAVVNKDGQYLIVIYELLVTQNLRLEEGVKPRYLKWANDKRVMFSFWQSEEFRGTPLTTSYLYTIDTETLKGKILIRPKGIWRQSNSYVVDWLENDPDHILMAFSEESYSTQPDVKKVNVKTGRFKTVKIKC